MFTRNALKLTPIAAACCMFAACTNHNNGTTYSGVVTSSAYVAGSATGNPTLKSGYYKGATVCVDENANGKCDSSESSTITDSNGHFSLSTSSKTAQFLADIPTSATNTATGSAVANHLILRASAAQVADQGPDDLVISPVSSEIQRQVEANSTTYAAEKANFATRMSGPAFGQGVTFSSADVIADINSLSGAQQYALQYEYNRLSNRYIYATAKLDRNDMYPDALAVAGGDPRLSAYLSNQDFATATLTNSAGSGPVSNSIPSDTRKPITFAQAQQAAFNIEGVPAYDHIFVIVEENKSTDAILGSARAPFINQLLSTYNQLTTYYSTGNPSEPNYTALGGGDDNGITDDNWYGCGASGANAPKDVAFTGGTASDGQLLPATGVTPPPDNSHLAGFAAGVCGYPSTGTGANHNVPGDNLFTLISKAGLTIRTYSESMNPGQDARADSVADSAVSNVYSGTETVGGTTLTVTDSKAYPVRSQLYRVKHGPSIAFQAARSLPDFYANNRTIFGQQYTAADWAKQTAYPTYNSSKWIYDQFGKDLATGDVGNINFVVPDQCDDMHGVGTSGTDGESCALGGSSSNSGDNVGVTRADIYLNKVVTAIKASPLWNNPQKRVAIVVMFDEGENPITTSAGVMSFSCCGWNANGVGSTDAPLTQNGTTWSQSAQPTNYDQGNNGHGVSIFSIISNQQDVGVAPKGIKDTDAYSHFSMVRTLQDMFQLADPAVDASYLNRAKYTEAFIAANILALPEFASSGDTHFDSVRPINHAYVIPANYVQRVPQGDINQSGTAGKTAGVTLQLQTGPDASQKNVWALQ